MKIDFGQAILDLDGNAVSGEGGGDFTLRTACIAALFAKPHGGPAAKPLSWEENLKRDELARRIHAAKEPLEIASEDVVMLKPLIAAAWMNPLVVAACCRMLEGKAQDGS